MRKKTAPRIPAKIDPLKNAMTHHTKDMTTTKMSPTLIIKAGYCSKNANPRPEKIKEITPVTKAA
jgi:hypothetical protein